MQRSQFLSSLKVMPSSTQTTLKKFNQKSYHSIQLLSKLSSPKASYPKRANYLRKQQSHSLSRVRGLTKLPNYNLLKLRMSLMQSQRLTSSYQISGISYRLRSKNHLLRLICHRSRHFTHQATKMSKSHKGMVFRRGHQFKLIKKVYRRLSTTR